MGNPTLISCAKGEWTKIATDVKLADIYSNNTKSSACFYTRRDTASPGADPTIPEGYLIFEKDRHAKFEDPAASDIWLYPTDNDSIIWVDA